MDKIKLTSNEFGILDGGRVELDLKTVDLWFEKGKNASGEQTVVMHLSAAFKKDDDNIAIGETESDFAKLGAFQFNEPTFLDGRFNGIFLFIDPADNQAVKLLSEKKDLVLKTNGKKRENGHALTAAKAEREKKAQLNLSKQND